MQIRPQDYSTCEILCVCRLGVPVGPRYCCLNMPPAAKKKLVRLPQTHLLDPRLQHCSFDSEQFRCAVLALDFPMRLFKDGQHVVVFAALHSASVRYFASASLFARAAWRPCRLMIDQLAIGRVTARRWGKSASVWLQMRGCYASCQPGVRSKPVISAA